MPRVPNSSMLNAKAIPRFLLGLAALGHTPAQASAAQSASLETTEIQDRVSPASHAPACRDPIRSPEAAIVMSPPPPSITLEERLAEAIRRGYKTIYLRGGHYAIPHTLVLGQGFNGITIKPCPGETPVFSASAQEPILILRDMRDASLSGIVFDGPNPIHILLENASDCTIQGNVFLHPGTAIVLDGATSNAIRRNLVVSAQRSGIELKNGSNDNRLTDNTIDGTSAPETEGGGVFVHGGANNRIAHNLIRNTAGFGIGISNWDDDTINIANVVVNNRLQATTLTADDSGAIYILGRSGVDTQTVISGNVIDGVGASNRHNVGIYLDDSTSGATVTHNLIRQVGSDAVQIHGGSDNLVTNNLLDISKGGPSAVLFQRAPADTNPTGQQTGNVVSRNVIILANEVSKLFVWLDGGTPEITGNLYASISGLVTFSTPPLSDPQARLADPLVAREASNGNYATAQYAGVAVGFTRIDLAAAGPRDDISNDDFPPPPPRQ